MYIQKAVKRGNIHKLDRALRAHTPRANDVCDRPTAYEHYTIVHSRSVVTEVDSGTNASLDCKCFTCLWW